MNEDRAAKGSKFKNLIKRIPYKAYLLYAIVATVVFTGVSFSRYASDATATSTARVAMFIADMTASPEDAGKTLDTSIVDDAYEYSISITNKVDDKIAEVTLKYNFHVVFKGTHPALALRISDAKVADTSLDELQVNAGSDTEVVFTSTLTFAPGVEGTNNHTLTFKKANVTNACQQFSFYVWAEVEQVD